MKTSPESPLHDYVSHLECSSTGKRCAHDRLLGLSEAGKPLLVRYDLEAVTATIDRDRLRTRPTGMWRYRELLPLPSGARRISLGEMQTPLLELAPDSANPGRSRVLIKDEGRLPTGSFKARGMALAISMADHFGVSTLSVPTAGNAGSAAAAYGACAGMAVYVFTPEDTPKTTVGEAALHGARVYRVNGLIDVCGRIARAGAERFGWHDLSTLAEPYRLEGKKTMGFELAQRRVAMGERVVIFNTANGLKTPVPESHTRLIESAEIDLDSLQ